MAKQDVDLMDGFDAGEYVFDERAEKRYHARIWIVIAACMAAGLLWGIFLHVKEISLKLHGNCIIAEYDAEKMHARYQDENGRVYLYGLGSYYPAYEGDSVRLYYRQNINDAVPATAPVFWLEAYALLGGIMGFCIWRIVRIYKKKSFS